MINFDNINLEALDQIIDVVNNKDQEVKNIINSIQNEELIPPYGCKHYLRRCKIISPCCDRIFYCRICHDDYVDNNLNIDENHSLDRFEIKEIICESCDTIQEPNKICDNCGITFGNYFCNICNLWDDVDKKQFHCTDCGMCRVNGKENTFHCFDCRICLSNELKDNHVCLQFSSCPVCMQDLCSSIKYVVKLKCGHSIHQECYMELLKTDYRCPFCKISLFDMSEWIKKVDKEISETPMPEEYRDKQVKIHCNDCRKQSDVLFHVIGLKCEECGSYNTRRE